MQVGRDSQLVRDLGEIFGPGMARAGDRAPLDRRAAGRDEAAFEALVARHGPMVRGVCGRSLADPHDVDDAFQATFLVLFLKGKGLRDADRVGPWLHGVAARVAAKARVQAARRRSRHDEGGADDAPAPPDAERDFDLEPVLDAEIARLPDKLRSAVVRCLVEGLPPDQAARTLGCPVGTVKSRLARGREALRARLEARGIAPAVPLAALASAASTPIPESLIRATARAVAGSRLAPSVVALARGVAPAMISKPTSLAALLVGGALLAGGGLAATWTRSPAVAQQPAAPAPPDLGGVALPDPAGLSIGNTIANMREVLRACHAFINQTDDARFPAGAIYGTDGQPKLSWRVALLPMLGHRALYNEFHRDEPWDSPHNKALIPRMPGIFATPDSPAPAGETRFRGFVGEGTMFDGGPRGVQVTGVPDGTTGTILIVQSGEPVVWTRPEGIAFPQDHLLATLDRHDPSRVRVGMGDGSVADLVPPAENVLRCMITRNGGEVMPRPMDLNAEEAREQLIHSRPLLAPPRPRSGEMGVTMMPGAAPGESVEQRLDRLEAKLDRLLEALGRRPAEAEQPRPGK